MIINLAVVELILAAANTGLVSGGLEVRIVGVIE